MSVFFLQRGRESVVFIFSFVFASYTTMGLIKPSGIMNMATTYTASSSSVSERERGIVKTFAFAAYFFSAASSRVFATRPKMRLKMYGHQKFVVRS